MKIRGHETFYIRKGWLHKGIKNVLNKPRIFTDKEENVCDILGVGLNQAKSIRYWLVATQLCEEERVGNKTQMKLTPFGELINQYDRFHEEVGTNMLIHYKLATNENQATAWYWLFNLYESNIIDKEIFVSELNFHIENNLKENPSKVLEDEYACIIKTYYSEEKDDDPEDVKVCPLSELGLISIEDKKKREIKKVMPKIESISPLVAYAIICDTANGSKEIKIDDLLTKNNSLGKVFNLTRIAIMELLDMLARKGLLKVVRTAGLDIISLNNSHTFLEAMEIYYNSLSEVEL